MRNLALALLAGVAGYALGAAVAGWWAGFLPGMIAVGVAYFVLARRTGKKVEAIFQQAVAEMQAGRLDGARKVMEAALPLGKEQFLVTSQVHAQLGALDYLEGVGLVVQKQPKAGAAKLATARAHLEKAWSRDWRSKTMLACLHHREGHVDDAVKVFAAAEGPGKSEPLLGRVGLRAQRRHAPGRGPPGRRPRLEAAPGRQAAARDPGGHVQPTPARHEGLRRGVVPVLPGPGAAGGADAAGPGDAAWREFADDGAAAAAIAPAPQSTTSTSSRLTLRISSFSDSGRPGTSA